MAQILATISSTLTWWSPMPQPWGLIWWPATACPCFGSWKNSTRWTIPSPFPLW